LATYVALLRAINLGAVNKIAMPALRTMFEDLGHQNVRSYVQSGNVVFDAPRSTPKKLVGEIEEGVAATFGHDISVIIRSGPELERVATGNPFAAKGVAPLSLHVVFLAKTPRSSHVEALDPDKWLPDKFEVRGSEIYLMLPNGMGRSKMSISYFEKAFGIRGTARNWNTVNKLRELVKKQ
jgi:uncharacterized protein (DUF1697 family)